MDMPVSAFFASPFSLPLPSELDDPANAEAPGQGILYFRNAGLMPVFGESRFHKAPRPKDVDYWTGVIQGKQQRNPKWLRQWLETYAASLLNILSDTQLAALLGVPLDRLCRESLHNHTLVATTLSPATVALWRKGAMTNPLYDKTLKKRNSHPEPNYQHARQRPFRSMLAAEERLPNHRPARPSPLRQSHTVEDEPPSPAQPSQPETDSSE